MRACVRACERACSMCVCVCVHVCVRICTCVCVCTCCMYINVLYVSYNNVKCVYVFAYMCNHRTLFVENNLTENRWGRKIGRRESGRGPEIKQSGFYIYSCDLVHMLLFLTHTRKTSQRENVHDMETIIPEWIVLVPRQSTR